MDAVQKGELKTYPAAKKFGIPSSTLDDHLKGRSKKRYGGPQTVLTQEEEKEIATACEVLQQFGFPLTKDIVGIIVRDYLKDSGRSNPFKDSIPHHDWWCGFLKRWPQLTERKPEHLQKCRAQCARPEVIDNWFTKMEQFLHDQGLYDLPDLASRLWNTDEVGFCTATATKSVLAKRGARDVHETGGGSGREYHTVLGAAAADGTKLPPYLLYKGVNMYERWTTHGPAGARYGVSNSGWMEADNFVEWFRRMFVPAVEHLLQGGQHVVLFVDGHKSHLSLRLIHLAKEKGIHLYCLPPHCTHILQPLDVGVYGPIKTTWKAILKEYKTFNMAENVTKEVFPSLIKKLWETSFKTAHVKSGFRATGLYPVNRQAIPPQKLAPSIPFATTSTAAAPAGPVEQHFTCHKCGNETTPVKLHVAAYFTTFFKERNAAKPQSTNKRVKPQYYGEALTRDEIIERMEEEERQKQEKEAEKQRAKQEREAKKKRVQEEKEARMKNRKGKRTATTNATTGTGEADEDETEEADGATMITPPNVNPVDSDDEETCQGCGSHYDEDDESEQKAWIGCDEPGCWRWYHYYCAGYSRKPRKTTKFMCIL